MSPPRGHSTIGVPKRCEGFMAIWLRAREEFADNRFQLLFMYRDTDTLAVLHVSVGFAQVTSYSGFEVTCPDCDLQSALDHTARDK